MQSSSCEKNSLEKELSGNESHIIRACVVLFVEQAVRVDKMRILTSELLCSRVHHIREFIQGTSHFLCETRCHFVCGSDEQSVQALLHSELLARVYTDTGASEFNTVTYRSS